MNKLITGTMYILWIATIIIGLIAVFSDFKYEDINLIALLLMVFTLMNTFFVMAKK